MNKLICPRCGESKKMSESMCETCTFMEDGSNESSFEPMFNSDSTNPEDEFSL